MNDDEKLVPVLEYLRKTESVVALITIILGGLVALAGSGLIRLLALSCVSFICGVMYQGYWTEVFRRHAEMALRRWKEALDMLIVQQEISKQKR